MSSAVRMLSGVLAAGLAVLALGVVGVWLLALAHDQPGPGATMLVGHLVAAAVALVLQRVADGRDDRVGRLASAGVAVVFVLVGVILWWL